MIKLIFTIKILFVVAVLAFKVWLFGSLAASSVKAISGSCGKTYGIESIPIISGNWFCISS